ncbi:MAG: elongation factor G [Phycisphaerae bacterium]|nr:elongation factor G [Phycisphaerae bacterium]
MNDIRNVVFLGHGGAGKTSLVESILHTAGAINRLGSIEDKNTVSDFDEEEKQRSHSIHSALTHAQYKGKLLQILDTPGYPDFMGAALQSIPAAEAAVIVISATSGIEVNTRKMFTVATQLNMPRIIVINKIDNETAELADLVSNIQESFGAKCRCANLPSEDRNSIIDCIANSAGSSPVMDVAQAHTELVESIIEADDALMEAYLGGEKIGPEKIAEIFSKALMAGTIIPILFTNARKEIGVKELLDVILSGVPSPNQAKPAILKDGDKETPVPCDPNGPLAGLVFRVGFDPRSNMKYSSIRLFSGKLNSVTQLRINDEKKAIRPGHPLVMQGSEIKEVDEGFAGQWVTLAKIDELKVGDLVHDGQFSGKFAMPPAPIPMYALALEPAARGDEAKLSTALEKLSEEDICFKVSRDSQTKELVIYGLGDLHLRVMLSKMENRFKMSVTTKQPKIPYRETITAKADGHYRHKKQTGGAGQFGEVYLRVEPAPRDSDPPLDYSWDIFGASIPGQFEPAILKGVKDVMESGVVAGFPLQDIKVSVYDGKHHPVDSKEVAFRAAGKGAFIDAVMKAKPALLEPIVNIEITVPSENMGDITGDMASRRGRISGQDMLPGGMMVIKAQVPLSEIAQYNSQLKSVTGGQGSYSMELSHYEPVPPNVQQQIVAQYAKNKEAEKE